MWEALLIFVNAIAYVPFHRHWPEAQAELRESVNHMRIYYYNTLWELSPHGGKNLEFSSFSRQTPSLLNIILDYPLILKFQKSLSGKRLLIQGVVITAVGITIVLALKPYVSVLGAMTLLTLAFRTGAGLILLFQGFVLFQITSIRNQALNFKDQYKIELNQ